MNMLDSNPGQDSGFIWSKLRGQRAGYDVRGHYVTSKVRGRHAFDNKLKLLRHRSVSMRNFLLVL